MKVNTGIPKRLNTPLSNIHNFLRVLAVDFMCLMSQTNFSMESNDSELINLLVRESFQPIV